VTAPVPPVQSRCGLASKTASFALGPGFRSHLGDNPPGCSSADVLFLFAGGKDGFDVGAGFASNGYGEPLPGGYSLGAVLVADTVPTFMLLLGAPAMATSRRALRPSPSAWA
jgi:hypothetical protein